MGTPELDPVDERIKPMFVALARAVLVGAALEKVLLVEIAGRSAQGAGLTKELGRELGRLEKRPAGELLGVLRRLGLSPEISERIHAITQRRNWAVHHFMADADVIAAFATGEGVDAVVGRLDQLSADCQRVINEIAPTAFLGAEAALGVSLADLIEACHSIDAERISDPQLRQQFVSLQQLTPEQLDQLRSA